MKQSWNVYNSKPFFDELVINHGKPRTESRRLIKHLKALSDNEMADYRTAANLAIKHMGISFTVYTEGRNIDRAWPFDIIPRIIRASEWRKVSTGLKQRSRALNCFINDVYNKKKILTDKIVPEELIEDSTNYKPQCENFEPRFGAWAHICGTDLVRNADGKFYVLEDNLRVPSGVSYMLENREITKRVLPDLFEDYSILPVDDYPSRLYSTLASISPRPKKRPSIVVLTPGIYNSAYFEHAFLAQGMGAELVEGTDLFVGEDEYVYRKTVDGPEKVDVVYRRIDDEFLDPEVFRKDSVLGVPGIMRAWKASKVAIANAPGSGVADDKAIYAYVPEMIRYYLGEEPMVDSVKTWLCMDEADRDYVLENIDKLVVKPVNESGGYGIMVGPHSSKEKHKEFTKLIEKNPRNYIAQPTLSLSTAPTYCDGEISPRHLDLRPFILQGKETWVTPGGLTRVALKEGSLVVNSSQGGGSKDTWIVEDKL